MVAMGTCAIIKADWLPRNCDIKELPIRSEKVRQLGRALFMCRWRLSQALGRRMDSARSSPRKFNMRALLSVHPDVERAKSRVLQIIDTIKPKELVKIVKSTPSLRGMIAGNIAELKFEQHLRSLGAFRNFYKPDDHNRLENKVDLRFTYRRKSVTVQLKSIQTNSIKWNADLQHLQCDVQNDGSDRRDVRLPNGHVVNTTNYRFGDYAILAVPLFPFTGKWDFAYLLNRDCTATTSTKYSEEDRKYLIRTVEKLSYPLSDRWTDDIFEAIRRL